MATRRDLPRHSLSIELRGGFSTTIHFASTSDLRRRQRDASRDRDRGDNENNKNSSNNNNRSGSGSSNEGRNGSGGGGGDAESRNGRNFRGGGGDSSDNGRGGENNGRGGSGGSSGGGNGSGGNGGNRGEGSSRGGGSNGGNGTNRGDGGGGGSGRGGNERGFNRGDGNSGGRNDDNNNSNNGNNGNGNGNRFRKGGNRNSDGRDRDTTTAEPASSASPTSSSAPAPSSAPASASVSPQTPSPSQASEKVTAPSGSTIPPEVNGAISSSSTSAPVPESGTAIPAPSATTTPDPAAATPSPSETTGEAALGPETSAGKKVTVDSNTRGLSSSSATSAAVESQSNGSPTTSANTAILTPASEPNGSPVSSSVIGISEGTTSDSQWQKVGDEMVTGQRGAMSGTTERVLISVGSIGAFIFSSFLGWIIWRTVRRSKSRKTHQMYSDYRPSSSHDKPGLLQGLPVKLPFLRDRKQQHQWHYIDEKGYGDQKIRPSAFTLSEVPAAPVKGFYGSEKADSLQLPPPTLGLAQSQQPEQGQPQTQFQPLLPQLRLQTEHLSGGTAWSPISSAGQQQGGSAWPVDPAQWHQMQLQTAFAAANSAYSPGGLCSGTAGTGASMFTHQTSDSFSSTNAAYFGATTPSSDAGGIWRSRMGFRSDYCDQSQLARQSSEDHVPAQRQINRASVLSSLSSGFGDGDIIVPQQPQQPRQPTTAYGRNGGGADGGQSDAPQYRAATRSSWTSRRDTVFTQSSDDSPPRYRTVTSWVRQQAGRALRAEHRGRVRAVNNGEGDGGIEGSSERAMPPEPRLNMMMDDGQAPRAPETVHSPDVLVPDYKGQ